VATVYTPLLDLTAKQREELQRDLDRIGLARRLAGKQPRRLPQAAMDLISAV
jgi:hypothetical protein